MKYIDLENYGRKNQYNNFIHYSNPIVSVSTTLDVTNLVKYCKSNKMSFFYMLFVYCYKMHKQY